MVHAVKSVMRRVVLGRLNECLGSLKESVRLVLLGDLNAKVANEPVLYAYCKVWSAR